MTMKKVIKKIALFSLLIFALQTAISSFNWGMIVFKEFEMLKKYLAEHIDIIFFGDSSVYTHDKVHDTDKRTIRQMLQDTIPDLKVMPVMHPAYHMDLYLEFCKYISENENKPKAVIVPVNIRSFSPEWDLQPMYQFTEEKAVISNSVISTFLYNVFNKPLKVFKYAYDTDVLSMDKFSKAPVYYKDSIVGDMDEYSTGFVDTTQENKKKKFLLRYMFYINKEHRKLNSLREITELMLKNNIKPYFYIIPVDYETGEVYFPGEFIKTVKRNATLLKNEIEAKGGIVLDLSLLVKAKNFNYEFYPNEHMKQQGRLDVAFALAQKLIETGMIEGIKF